jgi:hypothetical protein
VKRLLRILRGTWALLTLLLFVLTIGLWIRSYLVGDQFFVYRFENPSGRMYWTYYHVLTGKGGIGFNRLMQSFPVTDDAFEKNLRATQPPFHITKVAQYPDFKFGPSRTYYGVNIGHFAHFQQNLKGPRAEGHQLILPFWFLLLVLVLVGGPFWLLWYRARRRPKPGHCPICGYDLRASPNLCPECGHSPKAVKSNST